MGTALSGEHMNSNSCGRARFFTSKDPKNSIPVNANETEPKESLSADLSVIIEAKLIEARFVQNTHLKRIRRNSLRRPRT